MSAPLVRVNVHQHAGTIILNRPEKRNALSRALIAEISQAFDDLHQERRVRAVILTGAGPAFCAGMDLQEMQETSQQERPYDQWQHDAEIYQELLEKMLRFPKPIIAAVNGPAVAESDDFDLVNNISGPTVSGSFNSIQTASITSFTLE